MTLNVWIRSTSKELFDKLMPSIFIIIMETESMETVCTMKWSLTIYVLGIYIRPSIQ